MAEQSTSHWDELARQLGLEPKAQPEAPAASRDSAPSKSSEPAWQTPEPIAKTEEPAPAIEDAMMPEKREPFDLLDEAPAGAIAENLEIADFTMAEAESEEAVPEPKRRRGQRSRSGRGRDAEAPAETSEEAAAPNSERPEESSEQPPGRRGRGRGRGRSKKARSEEGAAVASDEAVDTEIEPVTDAVADEDDNEEIDNLSDWSVPSWQELIASLYRPER